MKKNGFTLAELLGVVVILGLLLLLVFPSVVKELKEGEANIDSAVEQIIKNGASNYVENNKNTYPSTKNATYCITLSTLVNAGEISKSLLIDKKGNELDLGKKVEVQIQSGQKTYQMNDQCQNS
ncbi:MAG: prepilin-type N-terminal cleavage/methylation domain-containing protein [Bacilli bacterium]|jgi:prepilin-type N-terminal cleavage/methylation domain-containing protein|nr:prepilin-type N-terminal cleavage/methylation domain-containing protein [Bacilli bacterium]